MRLLWRIFLSFFACTFVALAVTVWYANQSLRAFYEEEVATELATRVAIVARDMGTAFGASDWAGVDRRCKELASLGRARVTVVLPDGTVIGDSEQDPALMENHGARPEIAEAAGGRIGKSLRFSDTTRRTLMYLAGPIRQDGRVVGVVRMALPVSVIDWTLRSVYRHVVVGVLLVGALFAVMAYFVARWVSRPLEDMRRTAARLAAGDLRARVAVPRGPEMQTLARTLNRMAAQLAERMETVVRQGERQNAVLASMVEGVVAIGGDGRILDLNRAAAGILEVTPDQARGRSLQEVVRNPELQRFVSETLAAPSSLEGEIVLYGNEERHLQVNGTTLTGAAGENLGVLVVLNDITRIKRLETVRQDFVANVSHELRTPITALKGCVETLADRSRWTAAEEARFMAMMERHVDRLGAIVDDLLSLSRIEHDARHKRIPREPGDIGAVLRRAAQSFGAAAAARRMTLAVECPDGLAAPINAPLLEEAVGNLVDNAIKYGGEGNPITICAAVAGGDIEIRVADQGPGIERKHLSRIFERFYRVDQARSRALGGTGLGLAIVKHIALAHGGQAAVESTPGRGSTFTIRIPRA